MRTNEKSAERQVRWEKMDEFERCAENALAESGEILKDINRHRKRNGLPPLTCYPDGYK